MSYIAEETSIFLEVLRKQTTFVGFGSFENAQTVDRCLVSSHTNA